MEGLIIGMLRYGISICLTGVLKKSRGETRARAPGSNFLPFLTLATQATFIYLLLIYFVYIWFVLLFCIFVS